MMKTPKPQDSRLWRDSYYHKLFGLKAAHEAERVLKYFEEERPNDRRPRAAIQAIREWAEGRRALGMKVVRKLSLEAHAAARAVKSDAAKYAAHAAGQAVGTWHAPAHALGAFGYAGRAYIAGQNKTFGKAGFPNPDVRPKVPQGPVKKPAADERPEVLRPIASLISKSARAQRKLAPGTWQYKMLRGNLRALRLATALMNRPAGSAGRRPADDLRAALQTLAAMIGRVEKAGTKFPPGIAPHTLQKNRLRALRAAQAALQAALEKRRG